MATEVTVKVRDSELGQALFVQGEIWDLVLAEVRGILVSQEIETPLEYRFISRNGNVLSPALEQTVTFREVVDEPFAEIKKEDSSLHSAEERVVPQILLASIDTASDRNRPNLPGENETSCPFINKFPCLQGFVGSFPCMRNVFNINTLLRVAFILTCLLFLLVFVLLLMLHLFFGVGAVGGFAAPGLWMSAPYQKTEQAQPFDHEALTALKIQFSELEISSRFEIQDLKRKLGELEDLYLRDLDVLRNQVANLEAKQSLQDQRYAREVDNVSTKLDAMQIAMLNRWSVVNDGSSSDYSAGDSHGATQEPQAVINDPKEELHGTLDEIPQQLSETDVGDEVDLEENSDVSQTDEEEIVEDNEAIEEGQGDGPVKDKKDENKVRKDKKQKGKDGKKKDKGKEEKKNKDKRKDEKKNKDKGKEEKKNKDKGKEEKKNREKGKEEKKNKDKKEKKDKKK